MLNILAVSYNFPPEFSGGYGLQMGLFCEGLRARGHRISVLTIRHPTGQPARPEGLDVERTLNPIGSTMSPLGVLRASVGNAASVRAALRRVRPDIILCGGMDLIGFNTYLTAIEGGRPSLTWLGDTWLSQAWRNLPRYDRWQGIAAGGPTGAMRPARQMFGLVGRTLGLSCDTKPRTFAPVAAISQFVLDDLRTSGAPVPADTRIIPVSLHPGFFDEGGDPIGHSGQRTPELRALFVSRMEMLKGPDVAVRALAGAVSRSANVRLTLAGLHMDAIRPQLQALAADLGVGGRITWAGTPTLPDLISMYRNHDVFLFPSRIVEGLGVVNCEALACGLPIIGTAHSGSAEVIVEGSTGFRVDKDDAEAMASHLAALYADRDLLGRLSAQAPAMARRFAPESVLTMLEGELLRLTHER
jgi:glycosyltransferase involved in cell wall biosynthesis